MATPAGRGQRAGQLARKRLPAARESSSESDDGYDGDDVMDDVFAQQQRQQQHSKGTKEKGVVRFEGMSYAATRPSSASEKNSSSDRGTKKAKTTAAKDIPKRKRKGKEPSSGSAASAAVGKLSSVKTERFGFAAVDAADVDADVLSLTPFQSHRRSSTLSATKAEKKKTESSSKQHRRHSTGSSVTTRAELVARRFHLVLDSAQKTIAHHPSSLQASLRLYNRAPRHFAAVLRSELLRVISVERRELAVERLVAFFVKLLARLHSSWDRTSEAGGGGAPGGGGGSTSKSSSAGGARATLLSSQALDEDLGTSSQLADSQQLARGVDLTTDLLQDLLRNTNVKSQHVRFRVCQLVAGVVHELPELDNGLWDDIEEQMVLRLRDTAAMVRAEAARAMCRLQSPKERHDPVMEALLLRLGTDSSAAVRRAVLPLLALNRTSLAAILKRTRDVDALVRKQAFLLLAKIDVHKFQVAQRLALLEQGLVREQNAAVRSAAASMLAEKWLPRCDNDVVRLVEELGVVSMGTDIEGQFEEDDGALTARVSRMGGTDSTSRRRLLEMQLDAERICEKALPALFDLAPHARPELEASYFGDLSDARSLVWRIIVQSAARRSREHATADAMKELEDVLPNITDFAEFIHDGLPSKHGSGLATDFATRQLLMVACELDYSDEEGRQRMSELITKLLLQAPETLWVDAIKVARCLWSDTADFVGSCLAVVSDIVVPLESDDGESMTSGLRTDDPERLERALGITLQMMQHVASLSSDTSSAHHLAVVSHLEGILSELVLPCIQNPDPSVRNRAVRLLGVICSANRGWCIQYANLLVQVLLHDTDDVRLSALRAVGDAVMCFGLACVDEDVDDAFPDGKTSATLTALVDILKDNQQTLRVCGAEVLCKLYFCGAILSSEPLARLFLMLFDTTTRAAFQRRFEEQSSSILVNGVLEEEYTLWRLHEMLDTFFKTFSAMPRRLVQVRSRSNVWQNLSQDPKEVIEHIVLPVFRVYARNTINMAKLVTAPANAHVLADLLVNHETFGLKTRGTFCSVHVGTGQVVIS